MWTYNYMPELYHHGILGQRWGVRRFQNPDGSLTAAGRKRYGTVEALEAHQKLKTAKKQFDDDYNKADSKRHEVFSISKKRREANKKRWEKVYDSNVEYVNAKKDYEEKKREAKTLKIQKQQADVKRYLETYNRASELGDKSDELFDKAKEEYKTLGKNIFERMSEVSKAQKGNGSKAAEHYLKTWERAEELGNQSYDEFQSAKEQYNKLGRTYVERIIAVSKYDSK